MTTDEAERVFNLILAGWPTQRQRISRDDVRGMALLYTEGLADLEFEAVRRAIGRVVRTSEWLPTVAAIRAAVGVIEHGPQIAGGEAWGNVLRAIRERGSHCQPGKHFAFTDPITARVVKALGWRDLCASENTVADRARFIETYNDIAKTERTEAKAANGATNPQLEHRNPSGFLDAIAEAREALAAKGIVVDSKAWIQDNEDRAMPDWKALLQSLVGDTSAMAEWTDEQWREHDERVAKARTEAERLDS